MKKLVIFLILSTLTITAFGQTSLIPFQARLTDAGNTAVPDNVYNITFKVYDAATGGAPDWSENHINVSVIGGQINVLLGSLEPLTFNFITPKYLGITIGSGPEMVPRHQLVPSFHAQSASLAHEAEKLGGKTPDWYASKEHVAQQIADATADIEATFLSTDSTINGITSDIQDISSDVNVNKSEIDSLNNRIKTSEAKLYYRPFDICSNANEQYTFESMCKTRAYSSWRIMEGPITYCYYLCDGSAPQCIVAASTQPHWSPSTCNNQLVGVVLYESVVTP